jgi:hypothetical protein
MDAELSGNLYLVSKGVPFDVAFSLEPHERMAYCVILGEQAGGSFNWSVMRWDERK